MGVKFNPFTGNLDLVGAAAGGGGTPGGADTQVQFNDDGSFGGSADLTWDDTGKVLDVGGDINLDDGGSFQTTLQLVTPTAARTITFPGCHGHRWTGGGVLDRGCVCISGRRICRCGAIRLGWIVQCRWIVWLQPNRWRSKRP
jgi:hypothetical protein